MTKHLTILAVCLAMLGFTGYYVLTVTTENESLKVQIEKQQTELTMYKALVKQYRKEVTFNKLAK